MLWGSGFGPATPAAAPGEVVSGASPLLNPVAIRVGAAAVPMLFAGLTGVGLYQFNIVVPDLPDGDYPVTAEAAGVRTGSLARLRIRR